MTPSKSVYGPPPGQRRLNRGLTESDWRGIDPPPIIEGLYISIYACVCVCIQMFEGVLLQTHVILTPGACGRQAKLEFEKISFPNMRLEKISFPLAQLRANGPMGILVPGAHG